MRPHPFDRDAIDAQRRDEVQAEKFARAQLQADVQQVMNLEAMRRILWLFMQQSGLDGSPFATNAMQQSYGIGQADAAKWWVNLVREFCPEKEQQIRRDGMAMAKARPPATEDDET